MMLGASDRLHWDRLLLSLVLAIACLGLLMMASASVSVAERVTGDAFYYFKKQSLFLILGLLVAWVITWLPTAFWQKMRFVLGVSALILLVLVLLPGVGVTVNGSTRWIDLGLFYMQVSEPARLLILIYLSGYIVRHREAVQTTLWGFARPLLLVMFAAFLLLLEPDFGAATVLMGSVLAVLFLAGVRLHYFIALFALLAVAFAALALGSDYRLERLTAFRAPWAHQHDSGYQLVQALIAVGRGEWTGVGLGNSVQKLFYLPEAHTDFVFAVLAEELGLLGVAVTLFLYSALVWYGFRIARIAVDRGNAFAGLLAYGIVVWLGGQAFINMGVNLGLLPTKGLTLPLMSYGGSSLMMTFAALGILMRVAMENQVPIRKRTAPARRRTRSKR